MTMTLLLVALLSVTSYTVGFLIGRAERRSCRRAWQADRAAERLQQAGLDRPGNPRLN